MINHPRIVALLLLCFLTSQTACYNSYFISKNELQKLESSVEQKDTVTVYGDCPEGYVPAAVTEEEVVEQASYRTLKGPLYAQAEVETEVATDANGEVEAVEEEEVGMAAPETASDPNAVAGCVAVDVSTANPLVILTNSGEDLRVTPFNFIMSGKQIVSPEYDLLENLSDVQGAEVAEFSTWKTVGLIVGVTAAAVGAFVGISLLSGGDTQLQN